MTVEILALRELSHFQRLGDPEMERPLTRMNTGGNSVLMPRSFQRSREQRCAQVPGRWRRAWRCGLAR